MGINELRKDLHSRIDKGDEKLLKLVHALMDSFESGPMSYEFTEDQISVLEERMADYEAGKAQTDTEKEFFKKMHLAV